MNAARSGLAHSVQVRLAQHAKAIGVDPNLVLTRYAVERFLYRLSCSPHAERFVLKGALLLLVWLGETLRPTRDADLLGFGELSDDALRQIARDICSVAVEPDAVTLHALLREEAMDASQLVQAIASTFERRRTEIPPGVPTGLSDVFSADAGRQAQWRAFLDKNRLQGPRLAELVNAIRERLMPALEQARRSARP
jgi:hypothetical protein